MLANLHIINLIFSVIMFIFIVILDRVYLVKRHDEDIEWEKKM